ncbi:hypothetical protein [Halobacterium litoreum]|uniref:Zinc ribbon domain-containing protein n=1 Tax=Halobacterium litoreum TaxID=2039234 RepID=A0ABD5NCL3_9EURY|nr:hypothetical protein [Halobacterium litoreum]UHH14215.1 hypothetical protein LT972_04240 [Halobacterium litoreum]
MVSARTATAAVGVLASLAVSVVLWQVFDVALFFLAVPFVPFLFRSRDDRPSVRECPACGFRTRDAGFDYCPRDGTELERD